MNDIIDVIDIGFVQKPEVFSRLLIRIIVYTHSPFLDLFKTEKRGEKTKAPPGEKNPTIIDGISNITNHPRQTH